MLLRFTDNVIIQTTLNCNLSCEYCFQLPEDHKKSKKVLSITEIKAIIDQAIYERCVLGSADNYIDFHIHGGEALLLGEDTVVAIVDHILQRKNNFPELHISFQTNGTMLTESLCEELALRGIPIGVSIDGFTSRYRFSSKEDVDDLVKKLAYLGESTGAIFGILSVLHKSNLDTIVNDIKSIINNNRCFKSIGFNTLIADPSTALYAEIPSGKELWEKVYKRYLEDAICPRHIDENDDMILPTDLVIIFKEFLNDVVFESDKGPFDTKSGCFHRLCGYNTNMISVNPQLNVSPCDKSLHSGKFFKRDASKNVFSKDFLGMRQISDTLCFYEEFFSLEKTLGCPECIANKFCKGSCQAYKKSILDKCDISEDECFLQKQIISFFENHWWHLLKYHKVGIMFSPKKIKSSALAKLSEEGLELVVEENVFYARDISC